MNERVQKRDETVFSYFHDKVRMCRRLGLSAIEIKKMLCVCLYSRELSSTLLSNGHTSESELLADIRMYNDVDHNRSERFTPSRFNPSQPKRSPKPVAEKEPAPTWSKLDSKPGVTVSPCTGPRCYNCQSFGYIARDCTETRRPLRCSKCKQDGHRSKYCKKITTDVNLVSTQVKNSAVHYIKQVCIYEHKDQIQGFVDTGSAVCIIKKSTAERFDLKVNSKIINMWVYGKDQQVISKEETEAIMCVDKVKERIKLVVVDDELQNYDIIIVRSFTELDNVTFIKTKDKLTFGYSMKFPYQETDIPEQLTNRHAVRIKHETEVVPAESVKIVEAVADNETVEVMIINAEKSELSLHRGDHVGVLREQQPSLRTTKVPRTPITAEMVQYGSTFDQDEVNELVKLLNDYRCTCTTYPNSRKIENKS